MTVDELDDSSLLHEPDITTTTTMTADAGQVMVALSQPCVSTSTPSPGTTRNTRQSRVGPAGGVGSCSSPLRVPTGCWHPAIDAGRARRDGAEVVELTDFVDVTGWPKGLG